MVLVDVGDSKAVDQVDHRTDGAARGQHLAFDLATITVTPPTPFVVTAVPPLPLQSSASLFRLETYDHLDTETEHEH